MNTSRTLTFKAGVQENLSGGTSQTNHRPGCRPPVAGGCWNSQRGRHHWLTRGLLRAGGGPSAPPGPGTDLLPTVSTAGAIFKDALCCGGPSGQQVATEHQEGFRGGGGGGRHRDPLVLGPLGKKTSCRLPIWSGRPLVHPS